MAQRTVALCDGKFIGIESIYTVVDEKQIDKLAALYFLGNKEVIEGLYARHVFIAICHEDTEDI